MNELSSQKEMRMNYLKKTRRDDVGLLPLTSDSLEMLWIFSVERRQKWGRKEREIELERGLRNGEWKRYKETMMNTEVKTNFLSKTTCVFVLQLPLL